MYCGQPFATSRPGSGEPAVAAVTRAGLGSTLTDPDAARPCVGGYALGRQLGAGGMGAVYEGTHTVTGRKVAVKLISGDVAKVPSALERFRQEGKLASRITHPRCVFVLAADEQDGRPYIVMELMPGDTLRDLVARSGPPRVEVAVARILEVIEGLQEAHRLGVLHRDVKPSNCFLAADGTAKVGDFGLARALQQDANLTSTGAFLGTVLYAAPEQLKGEAVDYAADVYSVTATLYFLLTGRAPFQHDNPTTAVVRAITESPPPPSDFRPDLPASLERVVLRGLERDRARRYQTLDELQRALLALVPARPTPGGQGRRFLAFLLDVVLVLLLQVPLNLLLGEVARGEGIRGLLLLGLSLLYFGTGDATGGTPGKRLLGLRVARAGRVDPPGPVRSFARCGVFVALMGLAFVLPPLLAPLGTKIAAGTTAVGILLLLLPPLLGRRFRGLHEWASGTATNQLPLTEPRRRLAALRPDRLSACGPAPERFPETFGNFPVRGLLSEGPVGAVLLAEDPGLGRQLLVWVRSPGSPRWRGRRTEVDRPTRLRAVGSGKITLSDGANREWEAFVAPAGCPLADAVSPGSRLEWAETAPLLDTLAGELSAARADGTLPPSLTHEQVWVQADGRVQLLDAPVPAPDPKASPADPDEASRCLALIRQVATLALEGQPRAAVRADGVAAPLPRFAGRLLNRLCGARPAFTGPEEFRAALGEVRHRPSRVPRWQRALHLLVQVALLLPGLALILALGVFFQPLYTWHLGGRIDEARFVLHALQAPPDATPDELTELKARREVLLADRELAKRWRDLPATVKKLRDRLNADEGTRMLLLDGMPEWERSLLGGPLPPPTTDDSVTAVGRRVDRHARGAPPHPDDPLFWRELVIGHPNWVTLAILAVVLAWASGAFLTRGALAGLTAGVSLVRGRDGGPVGRGVYFLRVLLVWLPLAALLIAGAWARFLFPQERGMHLVLTAAALVPLVLFPVVALTWPARAPHDRLLGLRLVPR
jgi:uncharacterized RDD family membrane protein YckC